MASLWIRFCSKKRTPIKAMNNGIVTLAEKDLFYTGATLIFDHGHGFQLFICIWIKFL